MSWEVQHGTGPGSLFAGPDQLPRRPVRRRIKDVALARTVQLGFAVPYFLMPRSVYEFLDPCLILHLDDTVVKKPGQTSLLQYSCGGVVKSNNLQMPERIPDPIDGGGLGGKFVCTCVA